MLRRLALVIALAACVLCAGTAQAQVSVTVDAADLVLGYMNVFELPVNGGGFVFGAPWGIVDLTAVFAGDDVTLGPNTIGDPNEFWYQCVGGVLPPDCGGPGAPGNKIMEANLYAEVTDTFSGQTVTFSGEVLANSLTAAHTVVAFVKDYAPDYSSFVQSTVALTAPGPFTVSLAAIAAPGRHVQWGFQMVGENVWITDVAPFGTITIGPDMVVATEPASWGRIKTLY